MEVAVTLTSTTQVDLRYVRAWCILGSESRLTGMSGNGYAVILQLGALGREPDADVLLEGEI